MTAPTAKELLAQADRLMRRREPGAPEELPVLTDLVVEEIEMPSLEFSFDAPPPVAPLPKVARAPAPTPAKVSPPAPKIDYVTLDEMIAPVAAPAATAPLEPALTAVMPAAVPAPAPEPAVAPAAAFAVPTTPPAAPQAAVPNVREQFNAQIVAKLEEVRHAVFNQAMQQLELHADGGLKHHLRESLTERLVPVVDDIVQSVIEETTQQVREVVARAVDAEIARLREQLSRKR